MSNLRLSKTKAGVWGMVLGGDCGSHVACQLIKELNPDIYPVRFLIANTDAMSMEDQFGETAQEKEDMQRWIKDNRITLLELIPDDVGTDGGGFGAGGIPEVGRKAALSRKSIETLTKFHESVSIVDYLVGAGGGTGAGMAAVGIKLALEMGKDVVAFLIMPRKSEHRDHQANLVLREVMALGVPTLPLRNSYIDEYRKTLSQDERDGFTRLMAWKKMNDLGVIPSIRFRRELVQVTGDAKNMDQADQRNAFSSGNLLFQGIADITEEEMRKINPEVIVDRLFEGRCQDPEGYKGAEACMMWVHGPLSDEKVEMVAELVGQKVFEGRPEVPGKQRFHWGMRENVDDGKCWVAIYAVSKKEIKDASETLPTLMAQPVIQREGQKRVLAKFLINGEEKEVGGIWPDQRDRYVAYWNDPSSRPEDVELLREEIYTTTGISLDPPSWMKQGKEVSTEASSDLQTKIH